MLSCCAANDPLNQTTTESTPPTGLTASSLRRSTWSCRARRSQPPVVRCQRRASCARSCLPPGGSAPWGRAGRRTCGASWLRWGDRWAVGFWRVWAGCCPTDASAWVAGSLQGSSCACTVGSWWVRRWSSQPTNGRHLQHNLPPLHNHW